MKVHVHTNNPGNALEYGITTLFTTCIHPLPASLSEDIISENAFMKMRGLPVESPAEKLTVAKRSAMVL